MYKKIIRYINILVLLLITASCNNCYKAYKVDNDTLPADPMAYIYLQPYGDFTHEEAKALIPKIIKGLNKVYAGDWTNIKVLPNKPLPNKAFYERKNRYLANVLLHDLNISKGQSYMTYSQRHFNVNSWLRQLWHNGTVYF